LWKQPLYKVLEQFDRGLTDFTGMIGFPESVMSAFFIGEGRFAE
jgi:hypothetical protein